MYLKTHKISINIKSPLAMKLQFILFFLLLTKSTLFFSQDTFNVSIHHDTKLLLLGDDRGNHAGTLNLIAKVEIPIVKFANSYVIAYPAFEYAALHYAPLRRYFVGVGYVQKDVFFSDLNFSIKTNYGFINRMQNTTGSFGFSIEAFYRISRRFSLSYLHQIVQRTDFKTLYNINPEMKNSSFLGIKVHF